MGGCSATGCSSRNEKGKKLHCFPRDPVRREVWEKMVGRRNWKAHDRSRLCEDHFEESQYESRRMDNLRKLKPNAIPTKFPHFKKNKTLRRIVEDLTKTLSQSPLPERHSVEHSYSQSSEKGPKDKEDGTGGDLIGGGDDGVPGERILQPESFGLPLQCVFLCPLDGAADNLPSTVCCYEPSPEPAPSKSEEEMEWRDPVAVATATETPCPWPTTAADDDDAASRELAYLKDVVRKKDRRIATLLGAVANERRARRKLEREKRDLLRSVGTVFNADQLARLCRKGGREGVRWTRETAEKASRIRAACGARGYALLRAQRQPLPSLRCLRRIAAKRKARLEQQEEEEEADSSRPATATGDHLHAGIDMESTSASAESCHAAVDWSGLSKVS